MTVISWNIEGLNHPRKQKGLREVISAQKAKVCGVFETKLHLDTLPSIMSSYFPRWRFSSNFHLDSRGRVLLMWDPVFVYLQVFEMSQQHIGCRVRCIVTGLEYGLCFVYGLHTVVHRRGI